MTLKGEVVVDGEGVRLGSEPNCHPHGGRMWCEKKASALVTRCTRGRKRNKTRPTCCTVESKRQFREFARTKFHKELPVTNLVPEVKQLHPTAEDLDSSYVHAAYTSSTSRIRTHVPPLPKLTGVFKLRGAVALQGFQGLVRREGLANFHRGNREVVALLLKQNLHA